MPSSKKAKNAMIQLLPENIEVGVIYELGSGWGGLAMSLAKHYSNTKIVAFELSPLPYFFSRLRQRLSRRPNLVFLRKNFHLHNLSDAKAVVCYLYPGGMRKLAPKLQKELAENSAIISNTFSLTGWRADSLVFLDDWAATRIYRYYR